MADHLAQQIVDRAVGTTLAALATTGSNVFDEESVMLGPDRLPALRVFEEGEQAELADIHVSSIYQRTMQLVVEVCVQQTADAKRQVRAICKEVEVAVAGDNRFNNLANLVLYRGLTYTVGGEGDLVAIVGRMLYEVVYRTAAATPDVGA